mmetsp:Transcript_7489/g.14209  ORF Transcript_7489/g.14209 Transcript_7489/m.14209 type:complete len:489 (+) Transcript_7489:130-1596(+)
MTIMEQSSCCWLDRIQVPMNACSLETLYTPIHPQNNTSSRSTIHPLVIGCYQLNETMSKVNNNGDNNSTSDHSLIGEEEEDNQEEHDDDEEKEEEEEEEGKEDAQLASRSGELLLYTICENDMKFHQDQVHIVKTVDESGVLDGKWLQRGVDSGNMQGYLYATANASGCINIYTLEQCALDSSDSSSRTSGYQLRHVAVSQSDDANIHGLALSLAWDESSTTSSLDHDDCANNDPLVIKQTRIISSYSKGSLALHDIYLSKNEMDGDDIDTTATTAMIRMEESQRWDAHTLFACPSEVWTTCFTSNKYYNTHSNSVLSGGDDCKMKLWDMRTCHKPMHVQDDFEAGVTAVSYHPRLEHIFAVGSYDEKIRIWDMRKLGGRSSNGGLPLDCIDVGGGVWRIKWHPWDGNRMLVGAMHGGCRVLQIDGIQHVETTLDSVGVNSRITKEFKEHKSMAYGADWILSSSENYDLDAATSCSFYDKAAYIWNAH